MKTSYSEIKQSIIEALSKRGITGVEPLLMPIDPPRPWGVSSNVCFMLGKQVAADEIELKTDGLGKKEMKQVAGELAKAAGEKLAQELAGELGSYIGSVSQNKNNNNAGGADAPVRHEGLDVYRHRLPHWRLEGSVYFITWRLHPDQQLLNDDEKDLLAETIEKFDGERYEYNAYVIMDDHVHVIVKPFDDQKLEKILHSWKSFTANRYQRLSGRKGSVWQDEYFDRIIRDEDEFWEKAEYILYNPLKRWPGTVDYKWVKIKTADRGVRPTGGLKDNDNNKASGADAPVRHDGPAIPFVNKIEAEGAYLNFYYDIAALVPHVIGTAVGNPTEYGKGAPTGRRVMVEYAQPNTHKDLHVGHLRNASIGQAIANLLEWDGNDVLKATYIGDVGKHVAKAIWGHCSKEHWPIAVEGDDEAYAFDSDGIPTINEESEYAFFTVQRIVPREISILGYWGSVYQETNRYLARAKELDKQIKEGLDPEKDKSGWTDFYDAVEASIDHWLEEWESGNTTQVGSKVRDEWKLSRDECVEAFKAIFSELHLSFTEDPDCWFYESTVDDTKLGQKTAEELKARGIAVVDDSEEYKGALYVDFAEHVDDLKDGGQGRPPHQHGVPPHQQGDQPCQEDPSKPEPVFRDDEKKKIRKLGKMTILRSDGTSLYQTKELGLAKYKFDNFDIDESLYVVGAEQKLYFEQVFAILRLWGFPNAENCRHIAYELVVLPEGKMSSREGTIVSYRELRDEAIRRAEEITAEKGIAGDVARTARDIAIAAIKYAMLKVTGSQQIVFDFEEALSFSGRAAPYLQYAYARAGKLIADFNSSDDNESLEYTPHASEIELTRQISLFPGVVHDAAKNNEPATVCTYLYTLATAFSDFYRDCRVLGEPENIQKFRKKLVAAFRCVMENGFRILALPLPEEM